MLLMSIVDNMSELQVGDVLRGQYVDLSPRYYKVMKVTPKKVKVMRLKHRFAEDGTDLGQESLLMGRN